MFSTEIKTQALAGFAAGMFAVASWAAAPSPPLQIEDAALANGFQIQGVAPTFSPDGNWVHYTVCDPKKITVHKDGDDNVGTKGAAYHSMGCDIWLSPVAGGAARNLTAGQGNNWGPAWSPDNRWLAFYSDRGGQPNLWLWDRKSEQFRKVGDAQTQHRLGFEAPVWTPDSRQVVVKLTAEGVEPVAQDPASYGSIPVDDKEPGSTVVVFQSPKPEVKADDKPPAASRMQVDIGVVEIASGTVRRIVHDAEILVYLLSPDGRYLLTMVNQATTSDNAMGLKLIELASGSERSLAKEVVQTFPGAVSWSPDSSQLAYSSIDVPARNAAIKAKSTTSLTHEGGDLFVLNVQSGTAVKIEGAPTNHFGVDYLAPLWDAQGRHIYVLSADNNQVWKADVAAHRAQALTKDTARTKHILIAAIGGNTVASPDGRSIYATTRNTANRKHGFSRIDLTTGESVSLREEDKVYSHIFIPPAVSADGRQLVYQAESSQQSADIWIAPLDLRNPRRLTAINPQLDRYTFGRSQVIEFRSADGTPLKAGVLLPADYQPGKRYPTVVWVYASEENARRYVNNFGLVPMEAFNMQMFATRGYAVMWPDIPTHRGTPVRDLMKAVMPAIDRLVGLGIADADRLAVMGNSNGGYSTLALITQTKRFKAAVMNAGFGDMTAFYGTMGGAWIPWLERLGGSMQVPPWEAPLQYVENSPVYYLDRVQTPLIIQAGAADTGIVNYSDQVWVGLQRLNKDVTYLRYGGEGHVLAAAANLKDYWKRLFAFFDKNM